jgi:hypothetical protein
MAQVAVSRNPAQDRIMLVVGPETGASVELARRPPLTAVPEMVVRPLLIQPYSQPCLAERLQQKARTGQLLVVREVVWH